MGQDTSGEPMEQQDNSVEPMEQQDTSVEQIEQQDTSVERTEQDASIEPMEQDISGEPMEQDTSGEPMEQQDTSVEPMEQDTSVEPMEQQDSSGKPMEQQDSSVEPMEYEDSIVWFGFKDYLHCTRTTPSVLRAPPLDYTRKILAQCMNSLSQLLHLGKDYPKGADYFRSRLHLAFMRHKDVTEEKEIEMLIARGEYVVKELEALYMLRKYRTLKKRYYDVKP